MLFVLCEYYVSCSDYKLWNLFERNFLVGDDVWIFEFFFKFDFILLENEGDLWVCFGNIDKDFYMFEIGLSYFNFG